MFYSAVVALFRVYLRLFMRFRVIRQGELPKQGGVLVCANHYSWMDAVAVAVVLDRPVHFMAKDELFRNPILAALFRGVHAYPVRRGEADRTALKLTLSLLESGQVVGIFPEGTRTKTGELGPGQPGIGVFSHRARVPILPIGIAGSYKPFHAVVTIVGDLMDFSDLYEERLKSDELVPVIVEPVMAQISALRAAAKAALPGKH
jgi:1-acyl-sn-glycerol-3-phosphate acyltransferase